MDLEALRYFAKVIDAGGFASASRVLGVPKSRLSRRVAELEVALGARLLHRTTRKLALTALGERVLRHAQAMVAAAEMAAETVAEARAEPRGRVRLSVPTLFNEQVLSLLVPAFLEEHPLVQLDVLTTNRRVDLLDEGIDVALRVRTTLDEDPALVTHRIYPVEWELVAAPSLLREPPRSLADLQRLPVLGVVGPDRRVHLRLVDPEGEIHEASFEPRLASEHYPTRLAAALRGLGVTLMPAQAAAPHLRSGALVRALPGWSPPSGHTLLVFPHRRGLLPAVRALIDFLRARLAPPEL